MELEHIKARIDKLEAEWKEVDKVRNNHLRICKELKVKMDILEEKIKSNTDWYNAEKYGNIRKKTEGSKDDDSS